MAIDNSILVRCASCKWNFETRSFGRLECPNCHQEIWVAPPPGYEEASVAPDEEQAPSEQDIPEPAEPAPDTDDRELAGEDTDSASKSDDPPLDVVLKMLEDKMRARRETEGSFRPPWEAGGGNVFSRFITTCRQIVAGPTRFFSGLRTGSMRGAWTFGWIVCTLAVALFSAYHLWQFDANRASIIEMVRIRAPGIDPKQFIETFHTLLVIGLAGAPVVGLVNLFASAGLYHLGIMLTGRDHRGFAATLHATAYGFAPLLLTVVPIIGHLIGGIWSLIVQATGLAQVHRVPAARGVFAVTVPLLLIMLLSLGFL